MKLLSPSIPALLFLTFALVSCGQKNRSNPDVFEVQRRNMVRLDLIPRGIKSASVLKAMTDTPRHLFLPSRYNDKAYDDTSLPIAPFIETPNPYDVAKSIEALELTGRDKVLEVGTGHGYQSAILAELAREVYTIEIVPEVGKRAEELLGLLHYKNVHCRVGDGFQGWPEEAPFDAILVMAFAKKPPSPLLKQLAVGGRLVMPIVDGNQQELILFRKTSDGITQKKIFPIQMQRMEGQAVRQQMGYK